MKVKGLKPILAPLGTKKPRIIKKGETVSLYCDDWCKEKVKEGFLKEVKGEKKSKK